MESKDLAAHLIALLNSPAGHGVFVAHADIIQLCDAVLAAEVARAEVDTEINMHAERAEQALSDKAAIEKEMVTLDKRREELEEDKKEIEKRTKQVEAELLTVRNLLTAENDSATLSK